MNKQKCPETRGDVRELIQAIDFEREKRGISIYKMLKKAGISMPTWYHWLQGRCVPHMDLFLRLMLSMGMGLVMKGPTGQITVIRPRKMDLDSGGGTTAPAGGQGEHP